MGSAACSGFIFTSLYVVVASFICITVQTKLLGAKLSPWIGAHGLHRHHPEFFHRGGGELNKYSHHSVEAVKGTPPMDETRTLAVV